MRTSTIRSTICVLALLTTAATFAVAADETLDNGQRPQLNGEPTRVEVFLYLIDVTRIDGAAQSFTADLFMMLRWHDHRLASAAGNRKIALAEVWNPNVQILNRRSADTTFPEEIEVSADGTATFRQRFFGEFSARLDLHHFPMDRHTLGFHLVVPGYDRDEVALVAPTDGPGAIRSPSLSIVDWDIGDLVSRIEDLQVIPGGRSISGFAGEFTARRFLGFYLSKAILSVAIIVLMSWIVFWIAPKNIAPRMSVSVTAMLTLIAYRFLLGQMLPPLSYLTRMDHFLLGSTCLVFAAIVEVAAASHFHDSDRTDRALALDRFSRWAFPCAFLALGLVSFGWL